jgi:hypothetical protein
MFAKLPTSTEPSTHAKGTLSARTPSVETGNLYYDRDFLIVLERNDVP